MQPQNCPLYVAHMDWDYHLIFKVTANFQIANLSDNSSLDFIPEYLGP